MFRFVLVLGLVVLISSGCLAEEPEQVMELEPIVEVEAAPDLCQRAEEAWKSLEGLPYVFGGSSFASGGFDCSGGIYYVQRYIGRPIPRTTSRKMYFLAGGAGKHWSDAECLDWIWWTFTPNRPHGHVGMHLGADKVYQVGSSTGATRITLTHGSYWDRIFESSKKP